MKKVVILLVLFIISMYSSYATTWFPDEKQCPLCKEKSTYQVIGSYGSYIYHWNSKYQLIYWPLTDGQSIYSCPKCRFTTFMWDFDSIPDGKKLALKKMLDSLKINDKSLTTCRELEIAEKVYQILDLDTEFWCHFYRVIGYHYSSEKKTTQAKTVRLKALDYAKQLIADTSQMISLKMNNFIVGSMHHFTGNNDSALVYLNIAKDIVFLNPQKPEKESQGYNDYLNEIIDTFIEKIKNGKSLEDKDEE